MVKQIIEYSHDLLKHTIEPGEIVLDATCGNGNDTLFLSEIVQNHGKVLAFDIQKLAIDNSKKLMEQHKVKNVSFIHDSHAKADQYLKNKKINEIGGVIFNLGYLPRSDKEIITDGPSTTQAIENLLPFLKKDGLIVLVIYHGHEGGKEEKKIVLNYAKQLNQKYYRVLRYEFINQKNNPPFVIAIQKIKTKERTDKNYTSL